MRVARVHDFHFSRSEKKDKRFDYTTAQVSLEPSEYIDDLSMFEDDPKELHKFVVRTKFYIRKSAEYSELMKFLKRYRGMDCCGVHPNVRRYKGFQIEVHHTPLTIEDIVYIIINKRLKRGESLKMSAIAREVMLDHYLGLVGLYPLCKVCHKYAHGDNNDLFIPLDVLYGDPEAFFDIYDAYIADSLKTKFRNLQELTKGYCVIRDEVPDNLRRHLVYIEDGDGAGMISKSKLYDLIVSLNKD